LASALSGASGFWYGWSERSEKAELALAQAAAAARETEQQLGEKITQLDAAKLKEQKNAKLANDRYHDAVRAGSVGVSVPIARLLPASPAASGVAAETRAELDPAAAIRIDRVANDGDDAIRDLNSCIDAYNEVRDKVNQGK
jgi:hypothetical protein